MHAEEAAATKTAGPWVLQVRPLCLSDVICRYSLVIHLVEFQFVYLIGLADVNQWHGWSDHSQMILCLWAFYWEETKCLRLESVSAWSQAGKHPLSAVFWPLFCLSDILGRNGSVFGRQLVFYFGQRASIKSKNTRGKNKKNVPDLLSKLLASFTGGELF